jgi:hypothetical protein
MRMEINGKNPLTRKRRRIAIVRHEVWQGNERRDAGRQQARLDEEGAW